MRLGETVAQLRGDPAEMYRRKKGSCQGDEVLVQQDHKKPPPAYLCYSSSVFLKHY